jgi:hypothetical protein
MNGYYITSHNPTVKVKLQSQDEIVLSNMGLRELVLPKCKKVWCHYNQLTELIIPDGCVHVNCANNSITKLILPESCVRLDCSNNLLIKLHISINTKYINCNMNYFPKIIKNLFRSEDPIKIQLANNLIKFL